MEHRSNAKFYVYVHIIDSTGDIFYIGKGSGYRAASLHRNKYWHRVASKHKYTVKILEYFKTSEEACAREFELISYYKKIKQAKCNILPGGENNSGRNNPMFGKGYLLRGSKNGRYGKPGSMQNKCGPAHPRFGQIESVETRLKKSISHLGTKHPKHKWIYKLPLGEYTSISKAAEDHKVTVSMVKARCKSSNFSGWIKEQYESR